MTEDLFDRRRCEADEAVTFEDFSINQCWGFLLDRAKALGIELPVYVSDTFEFDAARDLAQRFLDHSQCCDLFTIEFDEDDTNDPLYCHGLTTNLIADAQELLAERQ